MIGKSKQSSPLVAALLPGGALLVLYACYCVLFPSQQAKEIALLATKRQSLVSQEIPQAAKTQVLAEIDTANEKLQAKTKELDELRTSAGTLLQGRLSTVEQLQSKRKINDILRAAGLTSVAHTRMERNEPKLLKSLNKSAGQLSQTLTQMASKDASKEDIQIPADLPLDINPLEWIAEQRRLRTGKFERVTGQASELQLVGDYQAMQDGLAELQLNCPEAMVTSVAFEKPQVRGATPHLIWKVRLQLQAPAPDATSSEVIAHRAAKVPVSVVSTQGE